MRKPNLKDFCDCKSANLLLIDSASVTFDELKLAPA